MANLKPNAQAGALTLVLLVKMYKSQMVALLVKNGIVVNNNASEEQVTSLVTNLLKVSKSFEQDLNNFITNPAVAKAITSRIGQTAQYYKMSGSNFMSADGEDDYDIFDYYDTDEPDEETPETDPVVGTPVKPPKKGFFEGFNLPDFLNQSMKLFGEYSKGKSDVEIAKARALAEQAKAQGKDFFVDPTTGEKIKIDDKPNSGGLSTTTIVIISLVGVISVVAVIIGLMNRTNKTE